MHLSDFCIMFSGALHFILFFKFVHERPGERQRHRQREKQALREEPDVGLDPRIPGSLPEPKADIQPLSHPSTPLGHFKRSLINPYTWARHLQVNVCGKEETQSVLTVCRVKPVLVESVTDVFMGARVAPAVAFRGRRVSHARIDVCLPSVLATWVVEFESGKKGRAFCQQSQRLCFVWNW